MDPEIIALKTELADLICSEFCGTEHTDRCRELTEQLRLTTEAPAAYVDATWAQQRADKHRAWAQHKLTKKLEHIDARLKALEDGDPLAVNAHGERLSERMTAVSHKLTDIQNAMGTYRQADVLRRITQVEVAIERYNDRTSEMIGALQRVIEVLAAV